MYNGANGDTFCEVLVSRRRGTPETVKAALAIIVGLLFSAVIILLVPMFFILLIPVWALVIFVVRMQKLEYEYIFTSGELDIDVLIGNWNNQQIYVKFTPNEQILDAMFRTSPNKVRRR